MSRMEFITLSFTDREPTPSGMSWGRVINRKMANQSLAFVPQFYWGTGEPWHVMNLWFLRQAELVSLGVRRIETLHAIGTSIKLYMRFLETSNINWWYFPENYSKRCLVVYRGYLISKRGAGQLSPSTCKRRMGDVLRFYDWLLDEKLLNPDFSPFEKRMVTIKSPALSGFLRTITVARNSLSIPNRRRSSNELEYGLEPLSQKAKEQILTQARKYAPEELYLMLLISFSTGMRLGSICDLKTQNLSSAIPCYESNDLYYLHIGPKARGAPVATKFSITGRAIIPVDILNKVRIYCSGRRRLLRSAKAEKENCDLVFLTRHGTPYARKGKDNSNVINTQLHRLKAYSKRNGVDLLDFKFHCARATFASEIAVLGLKHFGVTKIPAIIGLIKKLLMHKDEKTSLAYIKFIQEQELMEQWESEFYSSRQSLCKEIEQ